VAAPLSVLPSGLADYPHRLAVLAGLQGFRAELHACCTHRADALVDLADALVSTQGPVASLPQLSLEPAHRRGWGSLYAALARGRIQAERLRDLLARHPVVGGSRSTRSMSPPGHAATPNAHPSAACTTIPPATRPASRSWPTNGWRGSGLARPAGCRPTGSAGGFRAC
jgi:hypothetical protein